MKIVINKCYGGFGLSPTAVKAYLKSKGKKAHIYVQVYGGPKEPTKLRPYTRKDGNIYDYVFLKELTPAEQADQKRIPKSKWNKDYWCPQDMDRADKDFVKIVEDLGDGANGGYAKLKVIEIPDGVNYTIEDYDGMEHIAQVHETWG